MKEIALDVVDKKLKYGMPDWRQGSQADQELMNSKADDYLSVMQIIQKIMEQNKD